jgi:hypothetical protein
VILNHTTQQSTQNTTITKKNRIQALKLKKPFCNFQFTNISTLFPIYTIPPLQEPPNLRTLYRILRTLHLFRVPSTPRLVTLYRFYVPYSYPLRTLHLFCIPYTQPFFFAYPLPRDSAYPRAVASHDYLFLGTL